MENLFLQLIEYLTIPKKNFTFVENINILISQVYFMLKHTTNKKETEALIFNEV